MTTTATFIPLSVPQIEGNEWTYIKDCLDTGWVSSVGSYVNRFESDFAQYVGARYAVATSSGTTALHVALLVSGVQADEEVLVPSMTFIAPLNAIRYTGAWPLFMDSDLEYRQLDPVKVREFLAANTEKRDGKIFNLKTGRRISALLPVHILGQPGPAEEYRQIAREYNLILVDDTTESLGATVAGKQIGTESPASCYSFNGNKLITTGGGGMMTFQDEALAKHAKKLTTQSKRDGVEFIHDEVAYNYRLVNILAAMGCAQLEQIDNYIKKKKAIADRYHQAFEGNSVVEPMPEAPWGKSVFWLYTVRLRSSNQGRLLGLIDRLGDKQIQTRPLWQPGHLSPAHQYEFSPPCPVAEALYESCLSLPCSVGLTENDQQRVIDEVKKELSNWS